MKKHSVEHKSYTDCRNFSRYAKRRYAKRRYAECHGTISLLASVGLQHAQGWEKKELANVFCQTSGACTIKIF
jgi:hypothetical protein